MLDDAAIAVPQELAECAVAEWQHLGQPGTWWSGTARVTIAGELRRSRSCVLCRERKQSVSPEMVREQHPDGGVLVAETVDAVHRIASDPGRLTRRWYERVAGSGLEPGPYVEIVGITMTFTLVETLARALGCQPAELPEPTSGTPTKLIPDGAMPYPQAWVPMVAPSGWTGECARRHAREANPTVPNASWPLSLVPDEQESFFRLGGVTYLRPDQPLSTAQAELVAVTVSAANDCFY